jgi:hypothetical protein
LTRGKVLLEVDTDVSRLCLLIPERARIAEKIKQESILSGDEMRDVAHDLLALSKRNYMVFYLLNEEPVDGLCPVCNEKMQV